MTGSSLSGQASIGSMAEFRKNQDDGIAESVRQSQQRASSGKLVMGSALRKKGATKPGIAADPEHPAVIRIGVRSTQTGHDNRRQHNVR